MDNKEVTVDDFIKENFIHDKKYIEFDETLEVQQARTDQEKASWREVYSFAHAVNKAGRSFTETDIKNQCERFYLSFEKVQAVFQKVAENNKDEFGIEDKPEIFKVENFGRFFIELRRFHEPETITQQSLPYWQRCLNPTDHSDGYISRY